MIKTRFTPPAAYRCDADGKAAFCQDGCGQLHSPYWSARKSKGLHSLGQPTHRVVVV
jgi:hypothetical protein